MNIKQKMAISGASLTASLLILLTGCASHLTGIASGEFWEPSDKELSDLDPLVREYVFIHLSDQRPSCPSVRDVVVVAGTNGDIAIAASTSAPPPRPPEVITIDHIQLEKYRREYLGTQREGKRWLIVAFFNPDRFPRPPDGVSEYVSGGFPNFFTLQIDMEVHQVVDHHASRL